MDTAFISAYSALAGSIVGGLTSGLTTWLSLRSRAQAGRRLHHVSQREKLHRDFIEAASKAYGSPLQNNEPKVEEMVVLYGMVSRIRVLSSAHLIACAKKTVEVIIDAYSRQTRAFWKCTP